MLNPNKLTNTKPKPTLCLRTAHVCILMCTTVMHLHNTAQKSSDNLTSYPLDLSYIVQMMSTGGEGERITGIK